MAFLNFQTASAGVLLTFFYYYYFLNCFTARASSTSPSLVLPGFVPAHTEPLSPTVPARCRGSPSRGRPRSPTPSPPTAIALPAAPQRGPARPLRACAAPPAGKRKRRLGSVPGVPFNGRGGWAGGAVRGAPLAAWPRGGLGPLRPGRERGDLAPCPSSAPGCSARAAGGGGSSAAPRGGTIKSLGGR